MNDANNRRGDAISLGIIIFLYILGLIFFLPRIHYPYGDSWFYCRNVYDTMTSGRMSFTDAQAATPIFQIWLGVLLCKLTGGFGFLKLSLLGYFFSFLASIFTYKFIRLFTRTSWAALLGAVLLIAMPPFFKTSLAFMTDPFFYFGMALAFYFGARYTGCNSADADGLRSGSKVDALLTSIGFVIAILNRTNALLTSLAFITFVFINRKRIKPGIIDWVIHILPVIAFAAFQVWLKVADASPYYLGIFVKSMFISYLFKAFTSIEIFGFLFEKLSMLAKWAGYLGTLLLPVTVWLFIRSGPRWRGGEANRLEPRAGRIVWFVLTPCLIIAAMVLIAYPGESIILPNTITAYGLGLKNVVLPGAMPMFSEDSFTALQIAIAIGGMLLGLGAISRVLEGFKLGRGGGFIWWMLISTAAFPLLTQVFSDRYLIPIFPLLFVLMLDGIETKWRIPRWIWVFPLIFMVFVGLLANEYFGWNTARWEAIENSEVSGKLAEVGIVDSGRVGPMVEGGFEYSGFRYYDDEIFLDHYRALWEGDQSPDPEANKGSGIVPDYVVWWNLPKEFDYIVREEFPPVPAVEQYLLPWLDAGGAEYKPFPWSEPRRIVVYRRMPDVTSNTH